MEVDAYTRNTEFTSTMSTSTPTLTYSQALTGQRIPQQNLTKKNNNNNNSQADYKEKEWTDKIILALKDRRLEKYQPIDISLWNHDKCIEIFTSLSTLEEFTKNKLKHLPTNYFISEAILAKLDYYDTQFFRTFTHSAQSRPQHQREFNDLLTVAIERYKQLHDVIITNKTNRDEIFFMLRKKIGIDYLLNMDFNLKDSHEIAHSIFYLAGFTKTTIPFKFDDV